MRKLLLIIAIATMTVVANAQNKVTTAKTTPEMVYYYKDFSIVRMKDTDKNKDVYVPTLSNNQTAQMEVCRDMDGNIISFNIPANAFNWITSQGWELWLHDDNYNIIQRWFIRKKIPRAELDKIINEDINKTHNLEKIPSAVEELQRMLK